MASFCEHGTEPLSSIKYTIFVEECKSLACVGGTLRHAVRSFVKYEVPTVERKVAFHDLHVPWVT